MQRHNEEKKCFSLEMYRDSNFSYRVHSTFSLPKCPNDRYSYPNAPMSLKIKYFNSHSKPSLNTNCIPYLISSIKIYISGPILFLYLNFYRNEGNVDGNSPCAGSKAAVRPTLRPEQILAGKQPCAKLQLQTPSCIHLDDICWKHSILDMLSKL